MKRNRSIKIIMFSMTVFCCLVLSTVISIISMRKISQDHTTEFMKTLLNDVYHSISDELRENIYVARTIANDSFIVDILENEDNIDSKELSERLSEYTSNITETFSYSWMFIVSDKTKGYYSETGLYRVINPENEEDSWYREFIDSGNEFDISIGRDNDNPNPDMWTVFIDERIENKDGELLGVCGMAIELFNIADLINYYENEYEIEIILADENGMPQIISGDVDFLEADKFSIESVTDLEQIIKEKKVFNTSYKIIRYIEPVGWYLIIRDIQPYDYTNDYLLISFNVGMFVIFLIISIISLRFVNDGAVMLFNDSYADNMTGLYNRRAFDETLTSLSEINKLDNITVMVYDVNGLKKVNDTLGHAAGDEMIKAASGLIYKYFGKYGMCYRTGGDEFIAILDKPVKNINAIIRDFEDEMQKWEGVNVKSLSISYGVVSGLDVDCPIDEMIFHADEQMYKRKRKYYNNAENNRRRQND